MKILAIIVTYFPDTALLGDNINAIEDYVDEILVWENTPTTDNEQYRIPQRSKIKYVGEGNNVGIPKALNYAWRYARDNGFDFVLTMDQDSIWEDFGAFLDLTVNKGHWDRFIWGPANNIVRDGQDYEEKASINTSGMLVSTSILNKINGWPETFNIDCVDLDFCYAARQHGITILRVNKAYMKHQLGEPKKVLSIKTFKHKCITVHSPQRTYGIVRNGFIMKKKYPSFPIMDYLKGNVWKRLISILLYENHKAKQIAAIYRGLRDGLRFKMET